MKQGEIARGAFVKQNYESDKKLLTKKYGSLKVFSL